jgi:hypothetical protein
MCQRMKWWWTCDHPSKPSTWHPSEVTHCQTAVAVGVYANNQLMRCTGFNYSVVTTHKAGFCPGIPICRRKAFKKLGWKCHACNGRVLPDKERCDCEHKNCYVCKLWVFWYRKFRLFRSILNETKKKELVPHTIKELQYTSHSSLSYFEGQYDQQASWNTCPATPWYSSPLANPPTRSPYCPRGHNRKCDRLQNSAGNRGPRQ